MPQQFPLILPLEPVLTFFTVKALHPQRQPPFQGQTPAWSAPIAQRPFSTLSGARNQHVKTGCKKLNRSRFPCQLEGCERLFSTDANRRDHEAKRCRQRGAV
jgi:hypothetical protein